MDFFVSRRLAVVLALVGATAARADLFSPGELARAHEEFEGLSNCTKCHPAGKQLSPDSCLACHTELKGRVAAGKGLHGRLTGEQKDKCHSCHPDHQGRAFQMVDWGKEGLKGFDHRRSGWPLKGGHAPLECAKCHEPRRVLDPTVSAMLAKQPERKTWLGAGVECVACHFDEHRNQLGPDGRDCLKCHDEKKWKPAPAFNHDNTEYALKGRHKNNPKARCEDCHPKKPDEDTTRGLFPGPVVLDSYVAYVPINHKSCLDCHRDPHQGKLGLRCASCHTVDGWKIIRNAVLERKFHDKTKYPLRGAHADVECVSCHGPTPGHRAKFKGMTFDVCSACHADAHFAQLPKPNPKANGPLCEDCHTVEGFAPPKYGTEQHDKTKFSLEGAHRVTACGGCHAKQNQLIERVSAQARRALKLQKRLELFSFALLDAPKKLDKASRCEACHGDVHAGQFEKKEGGCVGCHKATAFNDLRFDHSKDSRYPLTGKHEKTPCASCHPPLAPGVKGAVRYKPLDLACVSCHSDLHTGQLTRPGKPPECERCHDTVDWKKSKFGHEPPFTEYRLDGKHAKVECKACHMDVPTAPGVLTRRYRPLPSQCEACHADYHRGAFKGFEP